MANNFWSKITNLNKDILERDGEEVTVLYYQEKETVKKSKKEKFLKQEKSKKIFQEEWLPDPGQGQLVVDIYEKDDVLVIKSAMAGAKSQDIDITVEPDLVVIRGKKLKDEDIDVKRYYYQECFWGKFSRTLILPCPIKTDQVKANFKNGILTVILPKMEERERQIKIGE